MPQQCVDNCTCTQDVARRVMSGEECGRFCALLVRRPPLPRGRFDALVRVKLMWNHVCR